MNTGNPDPNGSKESRDKWITIDRLCDEYEASLQEGNVERAPFLAGVPKAWREELSGELDAIDAAYEDADETREQTLRAGPGEICRRRLPTRAKLKELATLDRDTVWLGRFEIRKRLGSGATGSVWCARDARLGRWVALKVPHATRLMSETTAARFQNEARAAAAISHPNVVQVHEVLIEDGLPILVQQWIDGPSLAKYIKDHPRMDFDHAADWMAQIADAVATAHAKDIVHRDLKPANVMIDKNRPMVLDFGLASYPQSASGLTSEGTMLGTPAYMSPEQAEGSELASKPTTDIYAMGSILYEMLVGQPPFTGKTQDILQERRTARAPSPRAKVGSIPRDLDTIVRRCLGRSPSSRYANAEDLRDDLRRFAKREPILARQVSPAETTLWWCRTHPVAAMLWFAVPLFAMLMIVTLVLQKQAQQLTMQKTKAVNFSEELKIERHMVQLSQASRELSINHHARARQLLDSIPEDLRSWEWQLLEMNSQSPSKDLISAKQRAPFNAMEIARKRRRMFAASEDGRLWQWSLPVDRRLFPRVGTAKLPSPTVLFDHTKPIVSMAISPDEKWLAWIDQDGAAFCWDLEENELFQRLEPRFGKAGGCITFSPDSMRLLIAGGSKATESRAADLSSWYELFELKDDHFVSIAEKFFRPRSRINSVRFIGEDTFATCRGAAPLLFDSVGFIELWRIDGPKIKNAKTVWRGRNLYGLDFNPNSELLAWCDDTGTVFVCDTSDTRIVTITQGTQSPGVHVRFSPKGDELAVTSVDGVVSRWQISREDDSDARMAEVNSSSNEPPRLVAQVDQADEVDQADASGAAVDQATSEIEIPEPGDVLQLSPEEIKLSHVRDYRGHAAASTAAVFISPDEAEMKKAPYLAGQPSHLISCGADRRVLMWSQRSHAAIDQVTARRRHIVDAMWISPKQISVTSFAPTSFESVSYLSSKLPKHGLDVEVRHVPGGRAFESDPMVSPISQSSGRPPRYVVTSRDAVWLCEAGNLLPLRRIDFPEDFGDGFFTASLLLDSGHVVAALSRSRPRDDKDDSGLDPARPNRVHHLVMFSPNEDQSPRLLTLSTNRPVECLSLAGDGSVLVGGTFGGVLVSVPMNLNEEAGVGWESRRVTSWRGHPSRINDLAWLSNNRIASVSDDGTCKIWNITEDPSESELSAEQVIYISNEPATEVSVSAGGNRLATAGKDRVIRVWDTRSGLELISMEPRKDTVTAIAFSPDDQFLLVAELQSRIETIRLQVPTKSTADATKKEASE